jgi:hypothetical protein
MRCRLAPLSGRKRIVAPDEISEAPRRVHFLEQNPKHGFSPRDLAKAFARYWDVQVVGPPELIELELRSGRYVFAQEFVARFEALKANGLLGDPKHGGYSWPAFELAMEGRGRLGQALCHLAPTPAAEGDRRPFSGCRRPRPPDGGSCRHFRLPDFRRVIH